MKISVIIPTYNEEGVIIDCFRSLDKQSVREFEVILVDDGSSDSTLEKVDGFEPHNFKLVVKKQNHKGPGAARNLGSKESKGKILVFVDADMTFEESFLKNLAKPIIENGVKGTFSTDEYVSNWDNVWARCWGINEGWDSNKRFPKDYPNKQKVFRAILKTEFTKVNGFTPGGYNDDWSLSDKLGYEAINTLGAIYYHKNPDNLREAFYHAQWVGKRKYKNGVLGYLVAFTRSLLPVSVVVGTYKAIGYQEGAFIVFKIIYDLGILVGIVKMIFCKQLAK